MRPVLHALLSASLLAACSESASSTADTTAATDTPAGDSVTGDVSAPSDTADPGDAIEPSDSTDPLDTEPTDATGVDVEPVDAGGDTAGADTAGPEVVQAVLGKRCALSERLGIVELSGITDPSPSPYVSASLFDRPNPWYGEPAISTDQCRYHQFSPEGVCTDCTPEQLCAVDGACVPAPRRVKDAVVVVTAPGGGSQTFTADPDLGFLEGPLALSGTTFGVEVTLPGATITLAAVEAPPPVGSLAGKVAGEWNKPTSADITWAPAPAGTEVFTHIPINHHAAGPTFTECAVDASVGAMHVNGDMLTPLAVITGLEFQGVEHMRVAAAEVAAGCVELRFTTRQYVSLEPE